MTSSESVMVDIGIPTLGTSSFLPEAIESVLAQTFTAWRLTISENAPGVKAALPARRLSRGRSDPAQRGRRAHLDIGELDARARGRIEVCRDAA